jgi:DNA-binding protein YbaB
MSTEAHHPQVTGMLGQLEQFTSDLEQQMFRMDTGSFSATDEAKTVNVTVDGHHFLTGLYVEEGLLRLGAETVAQRINEALASAQAASTEATEAMHRQVYASIGELASSLKKTLSQS